MNTQNVLDHVPIGETLPCNHSLSTYAMEPRARSVNDFGDDPWYLSPWRCVENITHRRGDKGLGRRGLLLVPW